jgi:restriction system protein
MTLWLVHPGKYGEREQMALDKNLAIIGWDRLPDLSQLKERGQLSKLLEDSYPEERKKTLINWESQLWPFAKSMKVGDLVAMPLKNRPVIVFGYVDGKYIFEHENPEGFKHTLPVEWKYFIPRNQISQDLLYSFGSAMTVCKIQRNDAENRIKKILDGLPERSQEADRVNEDSFDLEQIAREQIREIISQSYKGHKLSQLTAAVLTAQGYKTRVSPPGADGGVDIIAGKGPLGFDAPKLVVQVKSSDSPIDVYVFRQLKGVIDSFGAETGLIVAWGGYKGQVETEAARHFFRIRLWNADDLVHQIQESYDDLPEDIKSELPLKKIWILQPQPED